MAAITLLEARALLRSDRRHVVFVSAAIRPQIGYWRTSHLIEITDQETEQRFIDTRRWLSHSRHSIADGRFNTSHVDLLGDVFPRYFSRDIDLVKAANLKRSIAEAVIESGHILVSCPDGLSRGAAVARWIANSHGLALAQDTRCASSTISAVMDETSELHQKMKALDVGKHDRSARVRSRLHEFLFSIGL